MNFTKEGNRKIELLQENNHWYIQTYICNHDIWKKEERMVFYNPDQLEKYIKKFFECKKL